ncbi:hypothetical protein PROFUN_10943 [Planoprotostelium fungivorum]|uniref:Uncharacterized protein n=1 Tax=Planoprotostelium fungivorum TaxID=1890364 RepID=A0A2P6NC42_9EUKA|nr:hypothetical protein PROFUN_10943 [Planoprotostelium fungivorum]
MAEFRRKARYFASTAWSNYSAGAYSLGIKGSEDNEVRAHVAGSAYQSERSIHEKDTTHCDHHELDHVVSKTVQAEDEMGRSNTFSCHQVLKMGTNKRMNTAFDALRRHKRRTMDIYRDHHEFPRSDVGFSFSPVEKIIFEAERNVHTESIRQD